MGKSVELTATVRGNQEAWGNGTPFQQSAIRDEFTSIALAGRAASGFSWTGTAYARTETSRNTFSLVNATRTLEIPVSGQYEGPASTFGASWAGLFFQADGSRTSVGADLRVLRGESREYYGFSGGTFANALTAGGQQEDIGLFASHDHQLTKDLYATVGIRLEQVGQPGRPYPV